MVARRNNNTTTDTQTPSSLTHFPSHICSSPFAVSVHTLQPPIYTSSSPCLMPSCQWPVGGCPTAIAIFSHSGEIKMLVGIVKNILLLWLGKRCHMWRHQRNVAGHVVRVLVKYKKIVTVPGKARTKRGHSEVVRMYRLQQTVSAMSCGRMGRRELVFV